MTRRAIRTAQTSNRRQLRLKVDEAIESEVAEIDLSRLQLTTNYVV